MRIDMEPVAQSEAIEQEFGIDVLNCQFTQGVACDSYVSLELNNVRVEELKDYINYCYNQKIIDFDYINRLQNELDLINKFRAIGYTDSIIIFVSW